MGTFRLAQSRKCHTHGVARGTEKLRDSFGRKPRAAENVDLLSLLEIFGDSDADNLQELVELLEYQFIGGLRHVQFLIARDASWDAGPCAEPQARRGWYL